MEIPVIASRVTGIINAVIHEKTGLLVNSRDSHCLASAMEKILKIEPWPNNGRKRAYPLFRVISTREHLARIHAFL